MVEKMRHRQSPSLATGQIVFRLITDSWGKIEAELRRSRRRRSGFGRLEFRPLVEPGPGPGMA